MAYTTKHTMLQRMRDGDTAAWEEFQAFYRNLILFLGKRYGLTALECEALVQEVMVACFKEHVLENYDRSKCRFRAYLRTIVKRKAELLRKARAENTGETEWELPAPDTLERQWEEEWAKAIQDKAMKELRETVDSRKFMVFELHVLQGRPRNEVAKAVGLSEYLVSLTCTRIKKRLAEIVARLKNELD